MKKIMIIEDDKELQEELKFLLENEGYKVILGKNYENLVPEIMEQSPNLLLLDIGLPGENGYQLCMKVKKQTKIPIIFVTSRDSTMDEVKAFSMGGDDFITKPYQIPVLIARIQSMLRRQGEVEADTSTLDYKGLHLDLQKATAEAVSGSCDLTKNELKILLFLMNHPGQIIARADLIEYLWDNQVYIDDNTLSVNITRLRGKLSKIGAEDYIITKRGMGYMI